MTFVPFVSCPNPTPLSRCVQTLTCDMCSISVLPQSYPLSPGVRGQGLSLKRDICTVSVPPQCYPLSRCAGRASWTTATWDVTWRATSRPRTCCVACAARPSTITSTSSSTCWADTLSASTARASSATRRS